MSLDVYLTGKIKTVPCRCDCGHEHLMEDSEQFYSANITHNLNAMADAAGIYKQIWRPEEIGITKAAQLIEPLRSGLALLKSDPKKFQSFNPKNGWGAYEFFVPFVESYLIACEQNPEADVKVWR